MGIQAKLRVPQLQLLLFPPTPQTTDDKQDQSIHHKPNAGKAKPALDSFFPVTFFLGHEHILK